MNRIRVLREECDMSQRQLATRLGLKGGAVISKYENGKNPLSEDTLRMLALIFDCSVDYILGLSDERKKGTSYSTPHIADLLGKAGELSDEDRKALVFCSTHPDALALARQYIRLSVTSRRRAVEYLDMLKMADDARAADRKAAEGVNSAEDEVGSAQERGGAAEE